MISYYESVLFFIISCLKTTETWYNYFYSDYPILKVSIMSCLLYQHSPESAHHFFNFALSELEKYPVNIVLSEDLQVFCDNFYSAGYFDNEPPTLAVALGKPFQEWFLVFIHEFCHFRQFVEQPEEFNRLCSNIDLLFQWVDGKIELSEQQISAYSADARFLEYDCEKRVLANLDNFAITHLVNAQEYAQKANSYFNFYNYLAKYRTWYAGGKEPYSLSFIWQKFPDTLVVETQLSPEHELLYQHCIA